MTETALFHTNSLEVENHCRVLFHKPPSCGVKKGVVPHKPRPTRKIKHPSLNVSDLLDWVEEGDDEEEDAQEEDNQQQPVTIELLPKEPHEEEDEEEEEEEDEGNKHDFIMLERGSEVDGWSVLEGAEDFEEEDDDETLETASQWTFASEQHQGTFLTAVLSATPLVSVFQVNSVPSVKPQQPQKAIMKSKRANAEDQQCIDFEGEYIAKKSDGFRGRAKSGRKYRKGRG